MHELGYGVVTINMLVNPFPGQPLNRVYFRPRGYVNTPVPGRAVFPVPFKAPRSEGTPSVIRSDAENRHSRRSGRK